MSYTERELSEALNKTLNPEQLHLTQKTLQDRRLVQSLRSVLESVPYLGSTKADRIIKQEDQFKQIR